MAQTNTPHPKATSRERTSRIDRAYFHRPSALKIMRRWLTVAGLVFGLGWFAWGAVDGSRHYAPGPVAAVHAKWENDCEACHVPFSPIKDNTWLTTANSISELEAKCQACHRVGIHNPLQIAAEVGSCGSCHADHRGRTADLNRVADHACTVCHASIDSHRLHDLRAESASPSASVGPITRFDDEHHPQFASLAADPGRLKFSHGRHMRLGLSFDSLPANGSAGQPADRLAWTYQMIPEKDRGRYQGTGVQPDAFVQLSCASCHEFGPSLPAGDMRAVSSLLASSPAGAYSLPVEMSRHCAACHSLPIEGIADHREATVAIDRKPQETMPHGLAAEEMRRFLEQTYLEKALRANGEILDRSLPDRPTLDKALPQAPLPAARVEAVADDRLRSLIAGQVDAARSFVRGGCAKCHDVEDQELSAATSLLATATAGHGARADTKTSKAGLPSTWFFVGPTHVPDVWLRKAKFNHHAHRATSCRECHDAAYPDSTDASAGIDPSLLPVGSPLDNSRVMIAGRHSCVVCHAPVQFDHTTNTTVGGARFDCVECHGYHGSGPHELPPLVGNH